MRGGWRTKTQRPELIFTEDYGWTKCSTNNIMINFFFKFFIKNSLNINLSYSLLQSEMEKKMSTLPEYSSEQSIGWKKSYFNLIIETIHI